jgi:hypothetical protein
MIVRRLFIALLLGVTLSAAGQWTLLDDFDQDIYTKRIPSGDTLQVTLSGEKTQGEHSLELIYSYIPADTWEKILILERPLAQTMDLSAMETYRCQLRVPEANPGLVLIYHLGDEEGIEMPCGDYDVLKQTHPSWTTKYYRLNDLRKTRWTTSGRSINLRKITRISYHIKNDKPLTQAGVFKLGLDQLEFLSNSGLLNEQVIENFDGYGATDSLRAKWVATHPDVELTLETSEVRWGKACLQTRFSLEKPGERRGATLALAKPLNAQGARYMKLSVFGDPQLAQCNALVYLVLTDSKGNQALGIIEKWPQRAEWADMYLPFEAEGVEGYRSNDRNSLEFDRGSCWQEDFDDGQPWNVRTNLAQIVKISLVVVGQGSGTYPVHNATVKFDHLVLGHTARPYSPSATARSTPRPTPSPTQVTATAGSSAAPFVIIGSPGAAEVTPITPFIANIPMPSSTRAASPSPAETIAPVTWYPTSMATLQYARSQGRPCILYFRAANVKTCEEIENALVLTPEFNQRAQRFLCMFEDLTQARVLAGSYNVFRVPDILLINGQGELAARFTFEIDPKAVLAALDTMR